MSSPDKMSSPEKLFSDKLFSDQLFSEILSSPEKSSSPEKLSSEKVSSPEKWSSSEKWSSPEKVSSERFSSPDTKGSVESNSSDSFNLTQSAVASTSQYGNSDMSWLNAGITSEGSWDMFCNKVKVEGLFLNLSITDHYDAWWKIITSAHVKPDKDLAILNCIKDMVESMPVSTLDDVLWCRYVEGAYILKKMDLISKDIFDFYLERLEEKLLSSYTKSGVYWHTIRSCEKKYNEYKDHDVEYVEKCFETYHKQFSSPYVNMYKDVKQLRKLGEKFGVEIHTSDFFSSEAMEKMISEANAYMNCFETSSGNDHHVLFEKYITGLLEQDHPQVKRALVLCEETICDEMYSVCYHYILAKTLCSIKINEVYQTHEVIERLFNALTRGIHLGREGCEEMLFYYLDYALNAAVKYFDNDHSADIFDDIVSKFKFDSSEEQYFASRKALIFGLKALIENEKMNISEFPHRINKLMQPITDDIFNGDGIFKESSPLPDFELKCMELKRLAISCRQKLLNAPWKDTLSIWKKGLSHLTDPHSLVEFATFIRDNGPPEDVEDAYLEAITHVERLNDSEKCSYSTRRCLFLLHQKLREFVAVHGGQIDTISFIGKFSKMQSKSSAEHNERYYLSHHTQIYDSHIAYYASISSANGLIRSSPYDQAKTSDIPVTQMKKLTVDPDTEDKIGYPVFLSNLNYKASKRDIVEAFMKKGLNVVRIKMGMSPKTHKNVGYARVEFGSQGEATQALEEHDRIKILGRSTFVSVCKEKEQDSVQSKKEPTLLFIQGLPRHWMYPDKINSFLTPFGHIKGTELDEETGIMKVDYYMAGDALIGSVKLQERFGKEIKVRRGFESRKDGQMQQKTLKTRSEHLKNQTRKTYSRQRPGTSNLEKPGMKKEIIPKTFVPQQLRQQMKNKLDLTNTGREEENHSVMSETQEDTMVSQDSESLPDYEDSSPPAGKKMKIVIRPSQDKLTNEDFRKMFNK